MVLVERSTGVAPQLERAVPARPAGRPPEPAAPHRRSRLRYQISRGLEARRRSRQAGVVALLARRGDRPGIAGTAYDTAWLASIATAEDPQTAQFPRALQWLVDHQMADGSWGGAIYYEHDRIISTLAALVPLARFGRRTRDRAAIAAGTRYLWQHGHLLKSEPVHPVGFELLLPALLQRAQQAGVQLPPHLDIYGYERAEKLRLLSPQRIYSARVTVVHSLEFLGEDAALEGLAAAQAPNGSIGNSPSATAFYYQRSRDPKALAYLEGCLARSDGATVPVLSPCEYFELLWAAYHFFLAGVPAAGLLSAEETAALRAALASGGISLSPSFPIPDADDTAVGLVLLHDLGLTVDPSVLQQFEHEAGYFASFPYERHSSVGVNVHVLHALLRVPGYPGRERAIAGIVDYLARQHRGLFWVDKWHISPYYATAHALCALRELPDHLAAPVRPLAEQSLEWVRQTQNPDGSWGFYGRPTMEETAYGLLALASERPARLSARDRERCLAALRYLQARSERYQRAEEELLPALWVDKCLYTPTLVVQAAIAAARIAGQRLDAGRPRPARLPQRAERRTATLIGE